MSLELRKIFLLKINRVRAAGKKIVYSDETYINQNHITPKSWCSSEDLTRANPSGAGPRLIIISAGTKEGELADSRKNLVVPMKLRVITTAMLQVFSMKSGLNNTCFQISLLILLSF